MKRDFVEADRLDLGAFVLLRQQPGRRPTDRGRATGEHGSESKVQLFRAKNTIHCFTAPRGMHFHWHGQSGSPPLNGLGR